MVPLLARARVKWSELATPLNNYFVLCEINISKHEVSPKADCLKSDHNEPKHILTTNGDKENISAQLVRISDSSTFNINIPPMF